MKSQYTSQFTSFSTDQEIMT